MLKQVEGSAAVAEAIALCRPQVICAYPISPQTHIVEALGRRVDAGQLAPCEFVNVESEFAAMSVAIGASATGARAYTATASQGLLFMAEAVYNAAGLGLPIVMTVANRAIGAPINIWNDHSDSMSMRDAGWIQLYALTNQEALDLHIQAFRLAEELSCPVMVCMDGFILTHAYERVDMPTQKQVDALLPRYEPRQILDPADPVSIGALVGPEAFTEVRYLSHHKQLRALGLIPQLAAEFNKQFGRDSGGLIRPYRTEDAETIVVALGSVNGTIQEVVDEMRESVRIIEQCLDQMPEGPFQVDMPTIAFPVDKDRVHCSMEALIQHFDLSAYGFKVPPGEVYSAIEAPKGELGFYIISDGSPKPFRMKVRAPSFVNLQGLFGVRNANYLADMIAVLGSLDPVIAEVDK